jgi:hypothetical protein
METRDERSDVSESVTVSLLIAVVATAMIYFELWGGSIPAIGGTTLAVGVVGGVVGGGAFYVLGTRSTSDQTVPVFGLLLTVAVVAFLLFPEGLPTAAEFGIVVAVWTDTAIRAVAKFG